MTYFNPGSGPLHNPIISTVDWCAVGDVLAIVRSAPTSTAWGSANRIIFVPFYITNPITVLKLLHYNGSTAAGNTCMGIFDTAGNRIVGSTNVAQSGTSAWQEHDITDTPLVPGTYLVGLKNEGTTGTYFATGSLNYARLAGVCKATGANGAMASSYTYAVHDAAIVPIVALALRSTI